MSRKMILSVIIGFAVVIAASAALRATRPPEPKTVTVVREQTEEETETKKAKVGRSTGPTTVQTIATPEPQRRTWRERRTTETRALSGRVTLVDGTPLAEATVTVNFNTSTTTNADGHYEFAALTGGVWGVSASHTDAMTSSVRGLSRDRETLDFVLRPKLPVRFVAKVFDAVSRDPVKNYSVVVRDREAVKDAAAPEKFEITKVFTGDQLRFTIEAPNTVPREVREWIPGDTTGTITREYAIGNGGTVKGRVVRGSTKAPVAGVQVSMRSFNRDGGPGFGFGGGGRDRNRDAATSATTDAEGKFVLARLNPGPVVLQLEPEQPLLSAMKFAGELQHNELKDVGDLEVGTGGKIAGKVVRTPGAATMDGVRVELTSFGRFGGGGGDGGGRRGGDENGGDRGRGDRQSSSVLTNASGHFEFGQVPPGPQILSIRNYAVRETVSIAAEETRDVVLRVGSGALVGTVFKDGVAVASAQVQMNRSSGGGFFGGFGRGGGGQNETRTDADGKFEIKDLVPGKWEVEIDPENARSARFDVEIPSEGKLERTFDLPSGDLVGKVVDAQGTAIAGASVSVMANGDSANTGGFGGGGGGGFGGRGGRGGRGVETGPDGTFRLTDREPGAITVVAYKQGLGYSEPTDGQVPEQGDSAEVLVRMNAGANGTLVSTALNVDTGGPIQNAWLSLTTSKGAIRQNQRRGEDGVLTVTGLPAGSYKVEVGANGFTTSQQDVDIKPGETTQITDVLSPGGSLRLNMVDTDGNPIANAACTLSPLDSTSIETVRQGTTNDSGSWTMRGVLPGSYSLNVTTADGKAYNKQITITAGGYVQETGIL